MEVLGSQLGHDEASSHGGWLRVWQDGRVQFKYLLVWDAPSLPGARMFEGSLTWHVRGSPSGPGAVERERDVELVVMLLHESSSSTRVCGHL